MIDIDNVYRDSSGPSASRGITFEENILINHIVTSDNFMYYYYLEYFMFIINQGQIHKSPYIRYIFKVMFYLKLSVYATGQGL